MGTKARTNTFRVAIAIEDYEKALNPDVWPYRVAVRSFRPSRRDRDQQSMDAQFGRTGGVFQNQQRQHHGQRQQHNKDHQQPPHPTLDLIELSNKFDVLDNPAMDLQDN